MARIPAGTLAIFAGPKDDQALRSYAESIGLTLLHPHARRMTAKENARSFDDPMQGGLFSFLPAKSLHPHPHPKIGVCEALDPVIRYIRPSYVPPHLVAGQVLWYTGNEEFAKQTRPYFQKIRRWVQKNWTRREEDGYYIGPDAERILREEGAQIAYMPPDVEIETRFID